MRAAPALQVTVRGRGAWRWVVAALAAASAAAPAWWLLSRADGGSGFKALAVVAASVLASWVALRALRRPPQHLRFDGRDWWLGASESAVEGQARSGEVAVVMDIGAWMLLRFDAPADDARKRCRRWLVVQRHELAQQWHALRCAVYSPRPGAPFGSRAAPVDPPSRE
jgi:hypothetical protein